MSVRTDVRLVDAPMQPAQCHTCGACVEVRKSSWDQTSIQWNDEALRACVERRATRSDTAENGPLFSGCTALRDTIREAAVRGDITIQLED